MLVSDKIIDANVIPNLLELNNALFEFMYTDSNN